MWWIRSFLSWMHSIWRRSTQIPILFWRGRTGRRNANLLHMWRSRSFVQGLWRRSKVFQLWWGRSREPRLLSPSSQKLLRLWSIRAHKQRLFDFSRLKSSRVSPIYRFTDWCWLSTADQRSELKGKKLPLPQKKKKGIHRRAEKHNASSILFI